MEAQSGAGSKRGWCGELSSGAQSSSACSASQQQQTGSAGKRPKQESCAAPPDLRGQSTGFFVLEHHAPQQQLLQHAPQQQLLQLQQQQLSPPGMILSADSSSTATWNNSLDVLQHGDQMTDCSMQQAGSSSGWRPAQQGGGLVRTASAPELVHLAQADSAAWQAQHAAARASAQQAALVSHHNHWLV